MVSRAGIGVRATVVIGAGVGSFEKTGFCDPKKRGIIIAVIGKNFE
jgi:hypothetical protein